MRKAFQINEKDAVKRCTSDVWTSIGRHWREIRPQLESYGFPAASLEGARAPFELLLAALGIHLRDIERLLPPEQARRVRLLLLDQLRSEMGEATATTVEAHEAAWQEALGFHQVPLFGPARLFALRLGCANPGDLHASIAANPLLLGVSSLLNRYGQPDWWPRLLADWRLVPNRLTKTRVKSRARQRASA